MTAKSGSFREKSFWLDEEYTPNAQVASDMDVNVAIVGGGFTGLSSAYFLKQADSGKYLMQASVVCL